MTAIRASDPRREVPNARRRALMVGSALGAVSLVLAGQAEAQAFNATPGTQAGSVTYNRANPLGAGTETITVNSRQAVILWNLQPGVFLPAGNTAYYQGAPGNGNFAVLNRINPNGAPVTMNGNLVSRISAANNAAGGTVAFYAPNGLIIGPNANFNVNRLVLSTIDVAFQASGEWISPAGQITFLNNPANPGGAIEIQPDATPATPQINATPEGAYVLMTAPSISQAGTVRANGAIAYVAAAGGTATYNAGLFDIVVTTGTTAATSLNHTGTTSGPASTGAADRHRIYLVGVPAASPIQMLLGGSIGFDAPLNATVENGAIILSSGFNVIGDEPVRPGNPAPGSASFLLSGLTTTSDVLGYSTGTAAVLGSNAFGQDLSLHAPTVSVAAAGTQTTIGGDLLLSTTIPSLDPGVLAVTGGTASLSVTGGGAILVAGNATLDASGTGRTIAGQYGNGVGGTAAVTASGGRLEVDGTLTVRANGVSPTPSAVNAAGSGTGGAASVLASLGGGITVRSGLVVEALGRGGSTTGVVGGVLNGRGGTARVTATDNSEINVTGSSRLDVSGAGGAAVNGSAGAGTGGTVTISAETTGRVLLNGAVDVNADGVGGAGLMAGRGSGGTIDISAAGAGTVRIGSGGQIGANGRGGAAAAGAGSAAGTGAGGTVTVAAGNASTAGRLELGDVGFLADGMGGAGASNGASGQGGTVGIFGTAQGGVVVGGNVTAGANGLGGAGTGGAGGAGTGGTVTAGIDASAAAGASGSVTLAGLTATASGAGGSGATGGAGTGGTVRFSAERGTVSAGAGNLSSSGAGGAGTNAGGRGQGGTVELLATNGQLVLTGQSVLGADGAAGAGAAPGSAGGGTLVIRSDSSGGGRGRITVAGLTGTARATGAAAGANSGGQWRLSADAGDISFADLALSAAGDTGAAPVLSVADGKISVSGAASLSSVVDLTAQATGTGQFAGSAWTLSGRNIAVTHAGAVAGSPTFDVAAFSAAPAGTFDSDAGSVIRTTGALTIAAGGAARTRGGLLGGDISVSGSTVDVALANGRDLAFTTPGALTVGQATATGDIAFQAGGAANITTVAAGGRFTGSAASLALPQVTAGVINVSTTGLATLGNLTGTTSLAMTSAGPLTFNQANGGAVSLTSTGGAITGGTINSASAALNGGSLDIGAVTTTGATSFTTPGTARFASVNAGSFTGDAASLTLPSVTAGVVNVSTAGIATLGNITGTTSLAVTSGGDLTFNQANGGAVNLTSTGGTIAGGTINSASAVLNGRGLDIGAVVTSGATSFTTPGAARFTSVNAGSFTGDAASLNLTSVTASVVNVSTEGTAALGDITGTTSLAVTSAGNLTFNQANGGAVTLTSTGGTIVGGNMTVASAILNGRAITTGTIAATGNVGFTTSGAAAFAGVNAGSLMGTAGALNLPSVTAATVDVTATAGAALLGTITGATSIRAVASGALSFNQMTGGAITLTSTGGDITGANASGMTLALDAARNVSLTGAVTGNEIRIASADIALGSAARLGSAGTQLVSLTAKASGQPTVIGGTTQGAGYTLTNDEAGQIRTAQLTVVASAAGTAANRTPDIVLRTLDLSATPTASGAAVGRFSVEGTGTILQVEGSVRLANAGTENGISITSPSRIQIVTDTGSLRVLDAAGLPAGEVVLASNNIWSANAGLIAQLTADPNFVGRNDALATNTGGTTDRGFLEGDRVTLRAGNTVLIQNSGTNATFAGVTTRGTLTITPTGASPLDVYAFGRRLNADGTSLTNSGYFSTVAFDHLGVGFTEAARFNDCSISSGVCTGLLTDPNLSVVEEEVAGPVGGGEGNLATLDLIDISRWDCNPEEDNTCEALVGSRSAR